MLNHVGPPADQSLKLTESSIDDFPCAKQFSKEIATSVARIFYNELAPRRRSLARVRWAVNNSTQKEEEA
jgi:hypothetical protein